ncbi:MAG: hypothetical protein EWV81_10320 [Microcystis aeruginosa Ma_SC_T_19800800_S464]|uniref:Transposase n=1 Tax=Microcystis aeruginosa Ma_SC_T_19800800_S464 TaxID=2486257 RepID=A0A552DW18_MICAE|nr:MAG: hypothetical protein EWV81_10320 [Microcystis aeruginosa Ma_SC_T_19800800_S464]
MTENKKHRYSWFFWLFLSIVFDLERTNQLSLLPDKDLVYSCHPIEPYQVTKNHIHLIVCHIQFSGFSPVQKA